MFQLKFVEHGEIVGFKDRIVAMGFSQIPGVDFSNTYCPVLKRKSVRILIVEKLWAISLLDVNSAYLKNHVHGEVYIARIARRFFFSGEVFK